MSANEKETLQSARVSLLGEKPRKENACLAVLKRFVSCACLTNRLRQLLALALLIVACPMLLYAERTRGWIESLFLEVKQEAHISGCTPNSDWDAQLVYVSCPIVYMHDFKSQVAGTFVENVQGGDLTGLSMELRSEIYQWKEVEDCRGCEGHITDANGDCTDGGGEAGSGVCKYTFQKAWVPEAVSPGMFHCREVGQSQCSFPVGGLASIQNTGGIPDSMRSFKKSAEAGSISIGTNPGRFYLGTDLIAQLEGQGTPMFFHDDALPKVEGKTTKFFRNGSVHELRLQTTPGSPEPDIGDIRASLTMTNFVSRDSNRQVSIVAKQAPYVYGQPHRTLVPWDANATSWKDSSPLIVDWLDGGISSFDEMVSDHRNEALQGVGTKIVQVRVFGVTCIIFGVCLLCGPLAKTWLSRQEWLTRGQAIRDIMKLIAIAVSLSFAYALIVASIPWFDYWELCAGLLLGAGLLSLIISMCVLKYLDTRANLVEVLREHKIMSQSLPPPVTSHTSLLTEDSLPRPEAVPEDYGATGDASSAGMADVEEGVEAEPEVSSDDNF